MRDCSRIEGRRSGENRQGRGLFPILLAVVLCQAPALGCLEARAAQEAETVQETEAARETEAVQERETAQETEADQETEAVPETEASQDETGASQIGITMVEYGNLRELLKEGNLSLKKSIDDYNDNVESYQEIWDTLKWEQDNMEDKAEDMEDEDSETAGIYSSNAAMLKSSASRIYSQLDSMTSDRSTRSLEKSADTYTMSAQTLMNSYNQMVLNTEYQAKRVEALQAAWEAMVRKQTAGSATQDQVKESRKSLDTAGNSLESLKLQARELRRQLLTMLGLTDSERIVIGAIPEPDMAAIDAVNYEGDKDRAMGNDSSVQNARHTSASSTTQMDLRFKKVEAAEGTAEAAFLAAYQDLLAKKTQYQAALASFQSAQLTYEGLMRKQQAGLLTNTEYLEGEAAYLEKKASKETASMNLVAAYEAYCWEVKGIG